MLGAVMVGAGGAIGAVLRYTIGLIPCKQTFPILTLVINILGAALIGTVTGISAKNGLSPHMTLFLKTGLCGGFTTFSTFSLEAYTLMQNGYYAYAAIYVLLSVIGCLGAVRLGMSLSGL